MKKTIGSMAILCSLSFGSNWSSNSVEFLYGDGHLNPFSGQETTKGALSFVHASGADYVSQFLWFDVHQLLDGNGTPGDLSIYGEWSPTLSVQSLTGKKQLVPGIKDIGLTSTLEFASTGVTPLYGASFALDVPGFAFLNLNPLLRDNQNIEGVTFQLTTAWKLPIEIGKVKLEASGFFDWALAEGDDTEAYFHTQPAFWLDIGNFWGVANTVQIGSEIVYWKNKFGIKGQDELVPQAAMRWTF